MNKCLTGSWFHCLFAFSSGFLLIGSDPLLSSSNGLPWLAAGLRHECRFDFISAYNLILILLFGICGSDFLRFRWAVTFSIVWDLPFRLSLYKSERILFQGLCDSPVCFWISGRLLKWYCATFVRMPSFMKGYTFDLRSLYVILCRHVFSFLFSFVLHKETKGTYTLFTFITTGSES